MSCSIAARHRKMMAGILGILMLLIVLSSAFYIAAEAGHDCAGEDCPICACIQKCENTLRQIGDGTVFLAVILIPVVFLAIHAVLFVFDSPKETLVSRKIRLNN